MTTIGSAGITFLNTTSQNTSGLINVQTFNASGTWTKPSGYSANSRVLIQTWGGGGSGGRNGTLIGYTAGGGGGGYNERWLLLSVLGATETVTVGAGGTARTTNLDGVTGGTTSVGSLINAFGGAGGQQVVGTPLGGGGGGQLSAGGIGQIYLPGLPYILYDVSYKKEVITGKSSVGVTEIDTARHGEGSRIRDDGNEGGVTINGPIMGYVHGGGGGGGGGAAGANTVYGGGGGGGYNSGAAGGASSFGGAGGAAGSTGTGVAGTQPGGGGGGATATSGAGGAGRVIITVFPNSN
jgi:hypothetical protein